MFSKQILLFCINFLIFDFSVNADRSCNVFLSDYNRQQANNLGICTKTLNYKTGVEKVRKSLCIMKCTMERLGLINSNGVIIDQHSLLAYIEKNFPKSLQQHAAAKLSSCHNGIAFNELDVARDDTCKLYESFIKCVTTTYRQLCLSEPKKLPNNIRDAIVPSHENTTKQISRPENILHSLFYFAAL